MGEIMKKLFLVLAILAMAVSVSAEPFVTSDAQEGVEQHLVECGTIYTATFPANPDGSLMWDLALWPGGVGWFDCTVKAQNSYEVEDVATGVITKATRTSDPTDVRIKIPNNQSNAGYKITE